MKYQGKNLFDCLHAVFPVTQAQISLSPAVQKRINVLQEKKQIA